MKLTFYKYQGTGNDFVMIDNRDKIFPVENTQLVNQLCDRRFGIGADGLILLENDENVDFKMVYYNADGNQSTMCGNGGRCLVAFANFLGVIQQKATFNAIDGLHYAEVHGEEVKLQMIDVDGIQVFDDYTFLNTGSPHHVAIVENIENYDVFSNGKRIRNGAPYFEEGTNVNFVEKMSADSFSVRTYERGVEDETYSCGTGVTGVAIAMHKTGVTEANEVTLKTPGGNLKVSFETEGEVYKNVFLQGKATYVFKGEITC
ncbi:diaminopimelate epimerase [Pustulibacterium marinum]|uniref:Diaminopimelate epimerase n=1 Tax=Pustulibacterium marinum TaxID=1224947 RepID=A0A1I7FNN3_9FLAO|nr:diaminopimelate epimerase [Pustulibacterium marinum]SFU37748.1 diaminopimelate epimerase [Pustulibacterium marinum]